jgi:hypothetical protein
VAVKVRKEMAITMNGKQEAGVGHAADPQGKEATAGRGRGRYKPAEQQAIAKEDTHNVLAPQKVTR